MEEMKHSLKVFMVDQTLILHPIYIKLKTSSPHINIQLEKGHQPNVMISLYIYQTFTLNLQHLPLVDITQVVSVQKEIILLGNTKVVELLLYLHLLLNLKELKRFLDLEPMTLLEIQETKEIIYLHNILQEVDIDLAIKKDRHKRLKINNVIKIYYLKFLVLEHIKFHLNLVILNSHPHFDLKFKYNLNI